MNEMELWRFDYVIHKTDAGHAERVVYDFIIEASAESVAIIWKAIQAEAEKNDWELFGSPYRHNPKKEAAIDADLEGLE